MVRYILRRCLFMLVSIILLSVVSFIIINLPPGDFISTMIQQLEMGGTPVGQGQIEALKKQYGFDLPQYARYFKWVAGMFKGNFGQSFLYNKPALDLIVPRLPYSILVSLCSILFVYLVAIPIGIYSATHQYSLGDYIATVFGFVGLAIPSFLLALILMYVFFVHFGFEPGGLFSEQYAQAAWSLAKAKDLLRHLLVPVIVVGTSGTAGLIRTMRATLLDELGQLYVDTARVKGQRERVVLFRYPVRVAINPILSTVGWMLPTIISGDTMIGIVLNLPTLGPLLFDALTSQDMYLAGTIVLFQSILAIFGTFLSDLLLAWSDPRIRFE